MDADLTVETAHSRYEFDTTAKLFTRTRVHERATDFGDRFSEPTAYDMVYLPEGEGESMKVYMPNGEWLHSTTVQKVTDLLEKVKA